MTTRKAFHDELDEITASVMELAGMAAAAIEAGTAAFVAGDLAAAEEVIGNDRRLDDLTRSIDERSFDLMARQQPMAVDLRTLVTVIRVIHDLERTGDYVTNIAKAARRLHPHQLDSRERELIEGMGQQALVQLGTATAAFAQRDPAQAAALSDMDDVMDELQKALFRHLFSHDGQDETIQQAVQIALVGRYYERMADHVVNFGERVGFMVTGQLA